MRKIFLTLSLSLALTVSVFAGGLVPITGFTGCENGLYYPDTDECVAGLAPSNSDGKQGPVFSETSLIGAILSFRDMIF
jgi:hypothetical protein